MRYPLILILAFSTSTPSSAQSKDETVNALIQFAYKNLDIGRTLNKAGVPKEQCIDEVEKLLAEREKDPDFLSPLKNYVFDKKAYLYMIIGGAAFSQCVEPKQLSFAQYEKNIKNNIASLIPRPKQP